MYIGSIIYEKTLSDVDETLLLHIIGDKNVTSNIECAFKRDGCIFKVSYSTRRLVTSRIHCLDIVVFLILHARIHYNGK